MDQSDLIVDWVNKEYAQEFRDQDKIYEYDVNYEIDKNNRLVYKDNIRVDEIVYDVDNGEREYLTHREKLKLDYSSDLDSRVVERVNQYIDDWVLANDRVVLHLK